MLGPDHPDTLDSMNNLAMLLKDQGKLEEAEPLFQQCLAGRKKVLGPDHPDTLITMYNFASFLEEKGDLANMETHARQSLEGYFSLGLTSDVKDGVEQLTAILRAQGKDEEAAAVEQTYSN